MSEIGQFIPLVSVIHYEMSQSQGTEADTCEPTHTFKDAIFTPGEETEEDRRWRHLAELTADSDVKAPGIWQRFKEEIQAISQNIYEKIWRTKKDEQTSSAWMMRVYDNADL